MSHFIQFALLTALVFYSGSRLSRYGDVIAEKTGMGRLWVGVVLMASVTSLPELMTGVSSVIVFALPDIATADVLGSCMFNILIIALLDVHSGSTPISTRVQREQILAAGFGILLLGIASASIAAGCLMPEIGWIGWSTIALILAYLIGVRSVFLSEKKRNSLDQGDPGEATQYDSIPLRTAYRHYVANALLVTAAASYLPRVAEEIATATGLGQTFVGSLLVAFTTSLPELTVSVAALRMNAPDLVFGNLFGSNLFNMAILAVDDLLYFEGPLLADVSSAHLVTANAAIAMTAIAVISLTHRVSKQFLVLASDSWAILTVYVLAALLLFAMR